ncbi:MAG: hypothetical protein ACE5KT_09075, partial [Methanosarcinales archaeon]
NLLLPQNNITTRTLTIGNNGTGVLEFEISDVSGTTISTTSEPMVITLKTPNDETTETNDEENTILPSAYKGKYLYFGISKYGEIMPFQYPRGIEHLRVGAYYEGYTVAYNDGRDHVAWAGYGTRSGITPVSYREIENTSTRLVVEVVTKTKDGLLEITQWFTFDKNDKYIKVQPTLKNLGSSNLTKVVYKRWADWDMDNSASYDTFDYDSERYMIYAYQKHYAAIASEKKPDYRDIDGWDDYSRRKTDEDYTTGPIRIDGLEILHHELGTLSPNETSRLTFVYGAGDNLTDLQSAIDRAYGSDWLTEYPQNGTVSPNSQANITVAINATSLEVGEYNATIVINNNDPDENPVNVPVLMRVIS